MTSKKNEVLVGERSPCRGYCCMRNVRSSILALLLVALMCVAFLMTYCIKSDVLKHGLSCCGDGNTDSAYLEMPYSMRGELEEYQDEFGITKLRYKHTKRRLPHCIIIGVRKGGTRALLEFLNQHPAIQAEKREMHFFDIDENYSNGIEWYRKRMPFSFVDQITMEKTPAYFTEDEVPKRIHAMNSTIKLLLILRDPIERAISDYTQIHSNKQLKGRPHESFAELALNRHTGEVNRSYKAIRRSMYHKHMARWLNYFPLEQFHFISGENLVQNPAEELRKVEDFLKIDHKLSQEKFFYNETRGFYCMNLDAKVKCLAGSKGRKHPEVSDGIMERLREFFRPHNHEFYDQVGINFGWQGS